MHYIIYLIVIWIVVAFIYGKVKDISFLKSFILMPIFLLKGFLDPPHNNEQMKREAKKQGRDDIVEKIKAQEEALKSAKEYVNMAEDKIKNK
jgi:hypothetical protein